jgi:hypothetical protein
LCARFPDRFEGSVPNLAGPSRPPFFALSGVLNVRDGRARACFTARLLAHSDVKREFLDKADACPLRPSIRMAVGMLPLPTPLPGGSINALAPFLNLPGRSDFVLVVARWTHDLGQADQCQSEESVKLDPVTLLESGRAVDPA